MKGSISVVTRRKVFTHLSWHSVWEWEEDFSSFLGTGLIHGRSNKKKIIHRLKFNSRVYALTPHFNSPHKKIMFHMIPPYDYNYYSGKDFVSIIIDCWQPILERIEKYFTRDHLIFLGSLQAVNFLNNKGWKNIHYLPVSISHRHYSDIPPAKDIDLLIYGRTNLRLKEWVYEIFDEAKFHVVKVLSENNVLLAYSNKKGLIGNVDSRKDLLELLNKSRNVAVSAPGIDQEDREDMEKTGGFSPVTPRFFESLACYANGVGVFSDNEDYRFCKIGEFTANVSSLEELKSYIGLNQNNDEIKHKIARYLNPHWSYRRIEKILECI